MRPHRKCLALFAFLLVLALAGVAAAGQVRVNVTNFDFIPRTVNVNPGDHVVWVWIAGTHTVTSGDSTFGAPANGIFNSGNVSAPGQFSWESASPGTFLYYCVPHRPSMAGRVIVSGSTVPVSDFRITEVLYNDAGGLDKIEISNVGAAAGNFGRYRLAVNGTAAVSVAQDNVSLAAAGQPGSILTIHANQSGANDAANLFLPGLGNLGDAAGSVALYAPNSTAAGSSLANAGMLIDFVQWGAAGQPNEATAATAGVWVTGQFVPTVGPGHSIELCNTATRNASAWGEVGTPNLGIDGDCLTPSRPTTWGRIKSLYR